jgi:hypothetical protein
LGHTFRRDPRRPFFRAVAQYGVVAPMVIYTINTPVRVTVRFCR